jgi:beta-N-acetylglucosaminidase
MDDHGLLSGVIEGFYGPPWSDGERAELLAWMAASGLNTYLYGPKDDLKHRQLWREPYSPDEAEGFRALIARCAAHGVAFACAFAPGLDMRHSSDAEIDRLTARCAQMASLGCRRFAVLFDDIPDKLDPADAARFGTLAASQAHVANAVLGFLRTHWPEALLMFCPTPYCGRMAMREHGGRGYLDDIGRLLHPDILVFWTGPEIISREITVDHVRALRGLLRRKPLIWDNLHANDYDGRRFYCGPYAGRSPALLSEVSGILTNPNCEFPLNYIPIRTLGAFLRDPAAYEPRRAYVNAMTAWSAEFETIGGQPPIDDLLSLGDCHYLPHEEGPWAQYLVGLVARLVSTDPGAWAPGDLRAFRREAVRWKALFGALPGMKRRGLFNALWRRGWELREELDLIEKYIEHRANPAQRDAPFHSDFHQPLLYRGGTVARLQALLRVAPDGSFHPSASPAPHP